MAKKQILKYVFTPGNAGVGTVRIPGKHDLNDLLLITNTTDNIILYNFADTAYAGTTAVYTTAALDAFPNLLQTHGGYTTITLAVNTTGQSSGDSLQIFVSVEDESFRPYRFGTDAIERMRVSTPQSLIDADFEYGLQPTKWAGYGTIRGYPSIYELPGVDLTVTQVTTDFTTTSTTNSLINVGFSTAHGLYPSNTGVSVSGLNRGIAGFSRADGNFVVNTVTTPTNVTFFARGIVGTVNGQSLLGDDTIVKRGAFYSGSTIPVTTISSSGADPSVMTVTTTSQHGLLPGMSISVQVASGTNAALATGPFVILSVPSTTTFTYLARAGGAVSGISGFTLYALSNSKLLHRPFDGGVTLATQSPSYGSTVVRQSKKYFRYQSGKGFLWSTGTLFKPNYDTLNVTSSGTTIGSVITVSTDDIEHGFQANANIRLDGISTSGYEGYYNVASILNDYQFTVNATSVLGSTTPSLNAVSKIYLTGWQGASVRAGLFDEQNGLFWEYDGDKLYAVRRSATNQLTGTIQVAQNSNQLIGANTRFGEQVRAGDKIVLRGMTHFVSNVANSTLMFVTPDYRGTAATGVRGSLITETRIPQSDFNIDTIDGTGPSGFSIDLNKMQMMGIQYTWYGAGFADFMVRGADGNWVFAHRIKNNNVNNEAYMRSGNLPVRYSIENDSPTTYLTASMDDSQTTIPVAETRYFPNQGTVWIEGEMISFTGKSTTSGAGNLTGCTRAATMSVYQLGTNNTVSGGVAATHTNNAGVILVSNTASPTLNHWGSALIMDGGYDSDRGYIFNYQRAVTSLTTTNQTSFLIRLAPSVSNSQVGALGVKDLLNRSQLLLEEIAISITGATAATGAVIVEGVLNPKNLNTATWTNLTPEASGGQPSFAQVSTSFTWVSGTFALPGEQVFAFAGPSDAGGATRETLSLSKLKELSGSPLGGDFKYPDGSDILAVNIRLSAGTATGGLFVLRWSEAQA
jgi:hypothetical protein